MGDSATLADRIERHRAIASALDGLSDQAMLQWLSGEDALRRDGFAALTPPGLGAPVFVKVLALTELEREAQHRDSTANCFGLPPFYNYRIGGAGFGVQRELDTHDLAHGWVESGERLQFPLLHGRRELPLARPIIREPVWPNTWGGHPAVAARHAAIEQSTHCVAVFLEYAPTTLLQWLWDRPAGAPEVNTDIPRIEARLLDLMAFINGHGLLHMDAHFENILTTGGELYLTDYGLAISDAFELGAEEQAFFDRHQDFDRITVLTSLVHVVFTRHAGSEDWRAALREFITSGGASNASIPEGARTFILRRGPLWIAMADFYGSLRDDITSEFPAEHLGTLLNAD